MVVTYYVLPLFLTFVLIMGIRKKSYNSFIDGCKKGISIAIDTFPYILSMIFLTKLLSASYLIIDIFKNSELPGVLIVQGIFRPLSSNASLSTLIDIIKIYGIDSKLSITSSILHASTETSFYVVTVYYGAVGIKKYNKSFVMALISNVIIFVLSLIFYYFL